MAADSQAVWQWARVVSAEPIATRIQQIVLQVENPRPAPPGSHIDVIVQGAIGDNRRSYSVVTADRSGSELTIAVNLATHSRGGSRFMHSLRLNDTLRITQPLQNFPLRTEASRHLLLAGGVGITALLTMARVLRNLAKDYRLVYVGRSRSRLAYLDELRELHGQNLQIYVDDESRPLDTAALVEEIAATGPTELYMCGPIRLMDAVRRDWQRTGLPPADLRYETFGNSGWFEVEEFVVEIPRLGVVTTVGKGQSLLEALEAAGKGQSLLEALEAAGVGVISDCLKGECGLCQVHVLRVDGDIDHRDVFFSDAEKRTSPKMCACVSRAVGNLGSAGNGFGPSRGENGSAVDRRALVTIDVP